MDRGDYVVRVVVLVVPLVIVWEISVSFEAFGRYFEFVVLARMRGNFRDQSIKKNGSVHSCAQLNEMLA